MNSDSLTQTSRPKILIFSPPNYLTLALIDSLLANFCQVTIIDDHDKEWKKTIDYLKENPNLLIYRNVPEISSPDYVIVNFLEGIDRERLKAVIGTSSKNSAKTVFVFPFLLNSDEYKTLEETKLLLASVSFESTFVYLGDLLGPRMSFDNHSPLSQIIKEILLSDNVIIKDNGEFFPVNSADAAKEIVELLFSFGPPAGEVVIYSEAIVSHALLDRLNASIKNKNFYLGSEGNARIHPNAYVLTTPKRLELSLKEVFVWFTKNPIYMKSVVKPVKKLKKKTEFKVPKIKIALKLRNKIVYAGIGLATLILVPFLSLFVSAILLKQGVVNLRGYQARKAAGAFAVSESLSSFSLLALDTYSTVPFIGKAFNGARNVAIIVSDADNIGIKLIAIIRKGGEFVDKIFGRDVYQPEDYSSDISLSLDGLYQKVAFLEGEINSQKGLMARVAAKNLKDINFMEIRRGLLAAKNFFDKAPAILGVGRPTSYFVLFQNNMELRPTGGFIGSFAILSFDGGRLTNIDVQDVYSADGQLKGHIEPPMPIKSYLGEANWYLRDANWDPDFPTTAARAEWFLGKEIDKSVDGVVGIDLEVAKRLLEIIGPLKLSDYNEVVTSADLYVKTQTETETNFFPGSTKKAGFLSALTKELLNKLVDFNKEKAVTFIKPLASLLAERHIQIFLHEPALEKTLSGLGFGGEVLIPSCSGNCYSDWLGLIDANLGVNKVNFFIKRNIALSIHLDGAKVERQLTVTYDNSANPAFGLAGIYKNYFRVLLPQDSEPGSALVGSGENLQTVTIDINNVQGRKEIGFFFEVLPGEKKTISLSWMSPSPLNFSQSGEYRLYLRKQAGTLNDPIILGLFPPMKGKVSVWPETALTKDSSYVYNTTLARDLFSRVSW